MEPENSYEEHGELLVRSASPPDPSDRYVPQANDLESIDEDISRTVSFESHHGSFDLRLSMVTSEHQEPSPSLELKGVPQVGAHLHSEKGLQPKPPKRSPWSKISKLIYNWWIFELLAFIFSLLSLTAIIIVLKRYDHHPLPDWPHNVTLNSGISWFTTLFKTNLLIPITACLSQATWIHFASRPRILKNVSIYDAASRGPMGSLRLLWKFHVKHIACIGALTTVSALGIDPIVQQTISIQTRNVKVTALANIPRAQSFLQYNDPRDDPLSSSVFSSDDGQPSVDGVGNDYSGSDPDVEVSAGEVMALPTPDTVSTMLTGLFSEGITVDSTTWNVDPLCPTGNCTFPTFQTLAVCSSCENITNHLSQKCFNHERPWTVPLHQRWCEFSLPNGLKLNKTMLGRSIATAGGKKSVSGTHYGHSLMNFTRIKAGYSDQPQELATNVTATQCFLYWCVKTFESFVSNGRLLETEKESWYSNTTHWWNGTAGGVLIGNDAVGFDSIAMSTARSDLAPPMLEPRQSNANFTVAWLASKALSWWLYPKLSLSTSLAFVSDDGFGFDQSATKSPDQEMIRLLESDSLDKTFPHLAKVMTANVRSTSPECQTTGMNASIWAIPGVGPANGTSTTMQIYVSVRWGWLAFPIALYLFAILFFTLTVLGTARDNLAVWKSSPFPLIFNKVEEPGNEESEPLISDEVLELEATAAQMRVMLKDSDTGLRLLSCSHVSIS